MADVILTVKIMPESPESDLEQIETKAIESIKNSVGDTQTKTEKEPIAFGLSALKIIFAMNEDKGSPESLTEEIQNLEGVQSCEIVDARRAMG